MTAHKRTIAARVSDDLLKKIERFHVKLAKKNPGVVIRQSDAIRVLLEMATAQEAARG